MAVSLWEIHVKLYQKRGDTNQVFLYYDYHFVVGYNTTQPKNEIFGNEKERREKQDAKRNVKRMYWKSMLYRAI